MFSASIKSLSVLVVVIQTVPNFQKQAIKVERMKTTAVEASVKLKAPEKERERKRRRKRSVSFNGVQLLCECRDQQPDLPNEAIRLEKKITWYFVVSRAGLHCVALKSQLKGFWLFFWFSRMFITSKNSIRGIAGESKGLSHWSMTYATWWIISK